MKAKTATESTEDTEKCVNTGERVSRLLRSPRIVVYAVGIALLLNLPSLGSGWQLDDLTHRAQF